MAISTDYRKRVLEYLNEGHSFRETAKVFKVSTTTISSWKALQAETGSLKKRAVHRPFKKIDPARLQEYVGEHPSHTLKKMAGEFGCSIHAIDQALRKLKITFKKRGHLYRAKREETRVIQETVGSNRKK